MPTQKLVNCKKKIFQKKVLLEKGLHEKKIKKLKKKGTLKRSTEKIYQPLKNGSFQRKYKSPSPIKNNIWQKGLNEKNKPFLNIRKFFKKRNRPKGRRHFYEELAFRWKIHPLRLFLKKKDLKKRRYFQKIVKQVNCELRCLRNYGPL